MPTPHNEPVKSYAPGSPEKAELEAALAEARSKQIDVPMYIGSEMVTTGALLHGKQLRLLEFNECEHPVALQLGGNDPVAMAECAALVTSSCCRVALVHCS